MSSFLTNKALQLFANGGLDWDGAQVVKALLERSTSTYVPSRNHNFLDAFTGGGGVELSVASYARQVVGTRGVTKNDGSKRIELTAANLSFGNLEAGQTVKGLLLYVQTGGNDASPADDELLAYFDGKIEVVLAANAAGGATTIYVDPLPAALASGTALDFGGGATCSLSAGAAVGARSLSVSAFGAAATAAATAANVAISGNILPFALGGGAFTVTIDAAGLFQLQNK
jgi:hypothetical protein